MCDFGKSDPRDYRTHVWIGTVDKEGHHWTQWRFQFDGRGFDHQKSVLLKLLEYGQGAWLYCLKLMTVLCSPPCLYKQNGPN